AHAQQRPFESEVIVQRAAVIQPHVRRPSAGAGGGGVLVGFVGRRRAAIGNNGGRAVVASSEGDAGNVEFGTAVGRHVFARLAPRGFAGGAVVLDFRGGLEQPQRVGEAARVAGVAYGQGLAFGLVGVEQGGAGLAFPDGGQFPAQIDGVFDRGVV